MGKKLRIILIDDDLAVLGSLSEALNLHGYPNRKFSDPQEAVELYKWEKFDVVITDIKMPEMNGIEVLKAVRKHNQDAAVIILTGYADTNNAITAVNEGAYAFFHKPPDLKSLLATLSKIEKELLEIQNKENVEVDLMRLYLEYKDLMNTFKSRQNTKDGIDESSVG